MVDSTPEDFPALAKRLNKEVNQQIIGNSIVGTTSKKRLLTY